MRRRGLGPNTATLLIVVALLSVGCSSSKKVATDASSPPAEEATTSTGVTGESVVGSTTVTTGDPKSATTAAAAAQPSAAGAPGNPLFPLEPGFQSVREGGVNIGNRRLSHRLVFTITDVRKDIGGVITVAALDQDFDGGELAEQSLDWFAIAKNGDVSYLGSYTETYEGGRFVNATDAWLAGVKGGKGGVLIPGSPKVGFKYSQAHVPGEGTATGEVVKVDQRRCVKFKCFDGVVVIKEDGAELKYFAPGAGGILTEPLSGSPQETEELINVTKLTPQGLAELSDEARRLDEHARTVAKDVYGTSAPAKRQ